MVPLTGEVVSTSERQGLATVLMDKSDGVTYSDRIQEIPLTRLDILDKQVPTISLLSL